MGLSFDFHNCMQCLWFAKQSLDLSSEKFEVSFKMTDFIRRTRGDEGNIWESIIGLTWEKLFKLKMTLKVTSE